MRVLGAADVDALLPMEQAIAIVADAMRRVSAGHTAMPLRSVVPVGGGNMLGVMPGALGQGDAFGVKLLSLFPGNPSVGLSSHLGAVLLFEPDHGRPVAMMNADRLTAIRTAAASAVATRALARDDAETLVLIGTGEQAESHLAAMCCVRPVARVRIVGRTADRAAAFAGRMRVAHPGLEIAAVADVTAACDGADIVCTVTSSATPVLTAGDIRPGTHVNAVGASVPSLQEIDAALVLKSDLFTDYRPSALAQAADIIALIEAGLADESHIRAEIGEVLDGAPGRSGPDAVTLYRSLGVIAQDLACAVHIAARATAEERGQVVSLD